MRRRRRLAVLLVLLAMAGVWWAASNSGLMPRIASALTSGQDQKDEDARWPAEHAGETAERASTASGEASSRETALLGPEELYPRASDPSWDPDSIHVLVNPLNPLEPEDYAPSDLTTPDVRTAAEDPQQLREEAAGALEQLFAAIREEGMELALVSASRSYDHQMALYRQRLAEEGEEAADAAVARPGFSEHQTGLAADVISIDNPDCITGDCFGGTPEGRWVAEHAQGFGFVIRYPEGAEEITGYQYEPWHLRYVGVETAEAVTEEGVTLEEYWDQPAAPDYGEPAPDL